MTGNSKGAMTTMATKSGGGSKGGGSKGGGSKGGGGSVEGRRFEGWIERRLKEEVGRPTYGDHPDLTLDTVAHE